MNAETRLWQKITSIHHYHSDMVPLNGKVLPWHGTVRGEVLCSPWYGEWSHEACDTCRFDERGLYTQQDGTDYEVSNAYGWHHTSHALALFHLRQQKPVLLAQWRFSQTGEILEKEALHLCGKDRYASSLKEVGDSLLLEWCITGPNKNERILCTYS